MVPVRLNPSLARTLRALRDFDGSEEFAAALLEKRSMVPGMSAERLVADIGELRDAGMVRVFEYRGKVCAFFLTSSGRDYLPNRIHDAAVAIGKSLFQLLCGAAGGLVVWLLSRQFG